MGESSQCMNCVVTGHRGDPANNTDIDQDAGQDIGRSFTS